METKKKIEDYLPLYLGCDVETGSWFPDKKYCTKKLIGVDIGIDNARINFIHGNILRDEQFWLPTRDIKPILRPLSSMTEEEDKEFRLTKIFQRATPVHSVGINVWTAESFKWLLSKHFDIFSLIESGLAIDSQQPISSSKI